MLKSLEKAPLKSVNDFLVGWDFQSEVSQLTTVNLNEMPVANAIVGSSVVSYLITGPLCCFLPLLRPTPPGGLPVPEVQANLIAFDLLSMAVIPQSTSVAMTQTNARFTSRYLALSFTPSPLCAFHFSFHYFHSASLHLQCCVLLVYICWSYSKSVFSKYSSSLFLLQVLTL